MIRRVAPMLAVVIAACASGGNAELTPTQRAEFPALLAQTSQEAGAGRFGVADKMLADYATRNPSTADAAESMYWRAVFKLDPSNASGSTKDATSLLDTYVQNTSAPHRTEAMVLRRVAAALESRANATSTSPNKPVVTDLTPDKAKDDEITRLKDELAKANAELDRIKKRLAQPTKP